MPAPDDLKSRLIDRCVKLYDEQFEQSLKRGSTERDAQREAISKGFEISVSEFGINMSSQLWKALQSAHVRRKSGELIEPKIIKAVTSANQSWNKSSGHAFEQSFCAKLNKKLATLNDTPSIKFLLQREVSAALNSKLISNDTRDITTLKSWLESSAFDVYAVYQVDNTPNIMVFGCVQCKTSIRDRVTRDREPSIQAMNAFFWSVAVVVDGDFLKLPKFNAMVNGGNDNFPSNGWHGMYVFSECQTVDRVKVLDDGFEPLVSDAVGAYSAWVKERQWLNSKWDTHLTT